MLRNVSDMFGLSGPVLRNTARLSQRYPPIARYGVFGVTTWPIGCDTPSPFSERFPLGEHAKWGCDTPPPPQKGYLSDTGAIPYQNKANGCDTPLCDTISEGYCKRYGGVSRTGPLSVWAFASWRPEISKSWRILAKFPSVNCLRNYKNASPTSFRRVCREQWLVSPINCQRKLKGNN